MRPLRDLFCSSHFVRGHSTICFRLTSQHAEASEHWLIWRGFMGLEVPRVEAVQRESQLWVIRHFIQSVCNKVIFEW